MACVSKVTDVSGSSKSCVYSGTWIVRMCGDERRAPTNDWSKAAGTWKVLGAVCNGKELPADQIRKMEIKISGNDMFIQWPDKTEKLTASNQGARYDPAKIDFKREDRTMPGIYRLFLNPALSENCRPNMDRVDS